MNPFSVLTELMPAKYRKVFYLLVTILAFAYGIWQSTNGDWKAFAPALLGAVVSAFAHANVDLGEEYEDEDETSTSESLESFAPAVTPSEEESTASMANVVPADSDEA